MKHSASNSLIAAATAIAHQVANLVVAPVYVVDEHNVVIAASGPRKSLAPDLPAATAGEAWDSRNGKDDEALRVPIVVAGQYAEVVIVEISGNKPVATGVAQTLIELLVKQQLTKLHLATEYDSRNAFVTSLLSQVDSNDAVMLRTREAKKLGIDLTVPRVVVLLDASSYVVRSPVAHAQDNNATALDQRAHSVISSATGYLRAQDDLWAYLGHGSVALLKASGGEHIRTWLADSTAPGQAPSPDQVYVAAEIAAEKLLAHLELQYSAEFHVGVGRLYTGPNGPASSGADARIALEVGRSLVTAGSRHKRVHCITSLGIDAFARTFNERALLTFARRLLAPLDAEPELRNTLEAFFAENCAVAATAKKLYLHRNTLGYRLDKVAQLTGLDPRRFDDAVQMRMAIQIVSGRGEVSELLTSASPGGT